MIPKQTSTKPDKDTIASTMSDVVSDIPPAARVRLDGDALVSNWRTLDGLSGSASTGAAVKANGYGLGVKEVVARLTKAGCRDFFVANWQEAAEIEAMTSGKASVSVLNGVREEDMPFALQSPAKPVLNSIQQVTRWLETRKPCDLMIDSGMNRLGIEPEQLGSVGDGLNIDLAMSHLASADENVQQNADQLEHYKAALEKLTFKRASLANSAGIMLGSDYHFDCTRPGIALYGGRQRAELEACIKQICFPQVQILQVRSLKSGDKVGYNAKYTANHAQDIATLAMGYADGYLRGFSNKGRFFHEDAELPVLGRVSMDLIAIDISTAPQLREGDWVDCEYDLPIASAQSGLSQYELITGLGQRLPREWA